MGFRHADMHVVTHPSPIAGGEPPFPINTLRNIGVQGAQSTHVFHLDVI